ncbi:transcriptional regulator [Morganella morganii]|uniref:transcriptional regulator n=1 Tax=Morganella morganii TaxID=582 RepID=UPI000468865A|nr:YdaS family helix-turn-helix protein [Morganella morganii]ELA9088735.1 helix-turn-helix domain-containing protein [Morganella morganii]NIH18380.1 helix-turn-helix domain-containing protein [Morganella morganii]HDU8552822.1 helix-turn-helix domain-containing protein [Morganella morganii]
MKNKLIDKAIGMVGNQRKLADACNVKQPTVWAWLHGRKKPSATSAKRIELATNGAILASQLRPDLHEIFG